LLPRAWVCPFDDFAGVLHLPRNLTDPYIGISGLFFYVYIAGVGIHQQVIRHNWVWGLVGAVLTLFTVKNVLSQPVSPRSGFRWFLICWSGVAYGLMDALLLPFAMLATWQALPVELDNKLARQILVGIIAVLANVW
jgi:hypothetical protein